jgi:hypothetical protein
MDVRHFGYKQKLLMKTLPKRARRYSTPEELYPARFQSPWPTTCDSTKLSWAHPSSQNIPNQLQVADALQEWSL